MGLMGFAKTVSRELGGYNIRVNAIAPGAAGGDRIERVLQGRATAQHKTLEEERPSHSASNHRSVSSIQSCPCRKFRPLGVRVRIGP
jgi:NAD(P)-dependent dehydrogenase (short-subunit alcohol dehydrogenase family)